MKECILTDNREMKECILTFDKTACLKENKSRFET